MRLAHTNCGSPIPRQCNSIRQKGPLKETVSQSLQSDFCPFCFPVWICQADRCAGLAEVSTFAWAFTAGLASACRRALVERCIDQEGAAGRAALQLTVS